MLLNRFQSFEENVDIQVVIIFGKKFKNTKFVITVGHLQLRFSAITTFELIHVDSFFTFMNVILCYCYGSRK